MKNKVAILCMAYNHEKYIRDALDSFVMQKTNFPFVAIIGEDCSTDGTKAIIQEYAEKYPDIIKPIYQEKNTGGYGSFMDMADACDAEYVAICEGDDYWVDENKLQKQVDFMDKHKEYSICFHPVKIHFEDGSQNDCIFPELRKLPKKITNYKHLLDTNFIQTNSVMYRWIFNKDTNPLRDSFPDNILPGDWYLHLLHARVGKIHCMPDVMAVYRRNPGGIWYNAFENDDFYLRNGHKVLNFHHNIRQNFGHDNPYAYDMFVKYMIICIKHACYDNLERVKQEFCEFLELSNYDGRKHEIEKEIPKSKKYKKERNISFALNILFLITIIFMCLSQFLKTVSNPLFIEKIGGGGLLLFVGNIRNLV